MQTPPPPMRLHTPPAPGASDYEPFSPRRSTRTRVSRVPAQHQEPSSARKPRIARHTTPTNSTPAPTTEQDLSPSSTISSDLLHSPRPTHRAHLLDNARSMYPTPTKTPRKRALQSEESSSNTAPPVAFPVRHARIEDAMPTPRKARKSALNPFSSTHGANGHAKIPIYTDSKDRIPTASDDNDNPFVTKGKGKAKANGHDKISIYTDSKDRVPTASADDDNPFLTKNATGKAKAKTPAKPSKVATKSKEEMEAMHRDKGDLYMFRGKKVMLKPNEERSELLRQAGVEPSHHFTRSTLQPRLLFKEEIRQQKQQQGEPDEAEEEPCTPVVVATSPIAEERDHPESCTHPLPQELTPPATVRTTRRKGVSSFSSWTRTKSSEVESSRSGTAKRSGDLLESPEKRSKGESSSSMIID